MLLHSLRQTTPAIAARVQKAVQYLADFPAVEQLEVACQLVVALLCVLLATPALARIDVQEVFTTSSFRMEEGQCKDGSIIVHGVTHFGGKTFSLWFNPDNAMAVIVEEGEGGAPVEAVYGVLVFEGETPGHFEEMLRLNGSDALKRFPHPCDWLGKKSA
jgi:hypothetical protein